MDLEHTDDVDWLKTELNRERIMVSNLVMDSQRLQADLNAQTEKVERFESKVKRLTATMRDEAGNDDDDFACGWKAACNAIVYQLVERFEKKSNEH